MEEVPNFQLFLVKTGTACGCREGWREHTRQSFEIKTDDNGACYVAEKLLNKLKITKDAKQSEQSYWDVRKYKTLTALVPVAAFKFYLSETHPGCKALIHTPKKQPPRR